MTLLGRLSSEKDGTIDEAGWLRFWNLYASAIRAFAVQRGGENDADDVVARVMAKLVDVFRSGAFDASRGNFRAYLAQMIRNEVGMLYRHSKAMRDDRKVSIDELEELPGVLPGESVTDSIDIEWAAARRKAVLNHIYSNPMMNRNSLDIYRAYVLEGGDIGKVAAAFHTTRNNVSQIKTRMEKTIEALAAELGA